jgi:hypothetical protein
MVGPDDEKIGGLLGVHFGGLSWVCGDPAGELSQFSPATRASQYTPGETDALPDPAA